MDDGRSTIIWRRRVAELADFLPFSTSGGLCITLPSSSSVTIVREVHAFCDKASEKMEVRREVDMVTCSSSRGTESWGSPADKEPLRSHCRAADLPSSARHQTSTMMGYGPPSHDWSSRAGLEGLSNARRPFGLCLAHVTVRQDTDPTQIYKMNAGGQ